MKKFYILIMTSLITCFIFLIFNIVSLLLPNKKIDMNISDSVNTIFSEGLYYIPFSGSFDGVLNGYQYDNFSDSKILLIAYDSTKKDNNIINRSVANYTCEYDANPIDCLNIVTSGKNIAKTEYSRYWFGTSFVIRFLLLLFDLQEIRYLNLLLVFTLVIIMLILLSKEFNIWYSIIYLFTFLNIGILALPFSLTLVTNLYISLISCIILLKYYKNDKFNKMIDVFFLLIGLFTSYFDLLTYPLFTFGIPFITWFILYKKENKINKSIYLKILLIGLSWIFGYIFANIFKFVISSLILKKNVFSESFNQIYFRLGNDNYFNSKNAIIMSINNNYKYIFNSINYIILLVYYLLCLKNILKYKLLKNINFNSLIIMIFTSLLPFLWYIIFKNHSIIHNFMTYRISAITLLALLLIPKICFEKE